MQRCTARFLLLLALVGTFLPLALSATAPPVRACCLRAAHHCHSASESEQRSVTAAGGCSHDCCRGVTISQTAHPKPPVAAVASQLLGTRAVESTPAAPRTDSFCLPSTRAP